jgi:hypothetical protein
MVVGSGYSDGLKPLAGPCGGRFMASCGSFGSKVIFSFKLMADDTAGASLGGDV